MSNHTEGISSAVIGNDVDKHNAVLAQKIMKELEAEEMTTKEFFELHGACSEIADWLFLIKERSMLALWKMDMKPEWRVWIASRQGVLDDKTLRIFACFCARQNWHLLTDERSRKALEAAEHLVDGIETADELEVAVAAWDAARDAAGAADGTAAREALKAAAWVVVRAATKINVWDAAWTATKAMSYDVAGHGDCEEARAAAWSVQSKWVVENSKPSFKKH